MSINGSSYFGLSEFWCWSYGMPTDPSSLTSRVTTMRRDMGNFVVRQIDAYRSISACELQKQLDNVFADQDNCCVANIRPRA
ncbi:MAG: hypothetical protein WA324_00345 [Bryobacteraceae bacterium]